MRPLPQGEGLGGWFTIKGAVVVAEDSASYTMQAVTTRPRPDGGFSQERSTVSGARLSVDSTP